MEVEMVRRKRGEGDGWLEVGPRWRPLEREGDGLTGRGGRRKGWAARGGGGGVVVVVVVDRKLFLFCFYRLEERGGARRARKSQLKM